MKIVLWAGLAACLIASSAALAQDAKPVKIGLLEDLSGVYSDITGKGSVAAAQLAVEDFGPTVLGRPIQLEVADHQNKADIGVAIARKWYDDQGVDMITGLGNTAVALAVREIARNSNKIDIAAEPGGTELTNEGCSPNGFTWDHDNFGLGKTIASATVKAGGNKVFMVAADYTFGRSLAAAAAKFSRDAGGTVLGQVNVPLGTSDFSSFILQAQSSGANNIGLAIAGADLVNFIKQANEFGLTQGGQKISAYLLLLQGVKTLGLPTAQGLYVAETFYWDLNDQTRAFAKRFQAKTGQMPNGFQASVYGAVYHYLKAVKAAGTTDTAKVLQEIRALPVKDFYTDGVMVRGDGLPARTYYLFRIKKPSESKGDWDLMAKEGEIPNGEAFETPAESKCPLYHK